MTEPFWIQGGIVWTNIQPLNKRVVPAVNAIPQEERPGYKKFEPVQPPEPPRRPFAGKDD